MEKTHIKDISKITEAVDGVKVDILSTKESDLAAIQQIVDSCAAGACDCMKPEIKEKVTETAFIRNKTGASIHIKGNISVTEIKETMENSQQEKNSTGCCQISEKNNSVCC